MSAPAIRHGGPACGLVLLLVLLAGCITPAVREPARGGPAQDTAAPPSTPAADGTETREFDPLLLPESPIRFGNTMESPVPATSGKPPSAVPVMQEPEVSARPAGPTTDESAVAGTGSWRVQLYSGRSPATADALVAEARLLFPEHAVDRVGEQADLKVLVGHFGSAGEAAGLKQRAVRLGFSQAWVVDPGPDTPH